MSYADLLLSAEEFVRKCTSRFSDEVPEIEIKEAAKRVAKAFLFLCEDREGYKP